MADFDLEKKAAKVNQILLRKGIKQAPIMRVGVAIDVSGSMSQFKPAVVQTAFNQLMGVAVKFDDNGELDVFKFDHNCSYIGTSKPDKGDYDTYLARNGIRPSGGTNYTPIVTEAMNFFFGGSGSSSAPAKKSMFGGLFGKSDPAPAASASTASGEPPVLMLILTDGEPSDASHALNAMRAASNDPIYFHMVGIGGERRNFPTIARLADELDNVGEVYLPRLDMSDDEIYEQIIGDELLEFVKKFSPQPQQQTA